VKQFGIDKAQPKDLIHERPFGSKVRRGHGPSHSVVCGGVGDAPGKREGIVEWGARWLNLTVEGRDLRPSPSAMTSEGSREDHCGWTWAGRVARRGARGEVAVNFGPHHGEP